MRNIHRRSACSLGLAFAIQLAATALTAWSLAAADAVIISEFMARNSNGLQDEDGERSDWIEIFNGGSTMVNLGGWHLTDDSGDPDKWTFPSTNLGANCFMIVWASGKDRAAAGAPLHTSFNLEASGEYLALVRPDLSIATEFAPAFPEQYPDISYGAVQQVSTNLMVSNSSPLRLRVPTGSGEGLNWTQKTFDDSAWSAGTNGVGFQLSVPGFLVKNYKANVAVNSTTDAESVISTPSKQSAVYAENRNVINYLNTGSSANYPNDATFPGLTINVDTEDFVLEATGVVTIPAAGDWTFGVNSDDGFTLGVGTFSMAYTAPRGPSDTLQTFNFPAAGSYAIRLVYFERGGGAEVELFAAQGNPAAWNSNFRLVGDTANGGLAVTSLPGGGSAGYASYIKTDVRSSMTNQNATAYLRIPFVVTNAAMVQSLTLLMKYDDGFVAYVNGVEAARRNAPATPVWNSTATASRSTAQAVVDEFVDLNASLGALQTGTNLLAIHGLNDSVNGDDFLIVAQLAEYRTTSLTNQYFAVPTGGTFNNSQPYYAKVADTKFSVDRGFYETNFSLSITCATAGATIRYTTNGSAPSAGNGTVYSGPLTITRTTTLRAAAFKNGYTPSDVDTQTYFFLRDVLQQQEDVAPGPDWPAAGTTVNGQIASYGLASDVMSNPLYGGAASNALRSIPTFSVVMNLADIWSAATGFYVNGNATTPLESPCSLELIHPDGTKGFQANCGITTRGGYSRGGDNPKHGLRFFFRTEYGPGQLNYPLFGTTNGGASSFDRFDLRTFQNYSWSFGGDSSFTGLRDQFSRDMQLALGPVGSRGNYYHLYINGHYWGLYNTDERPEENYGASYFGGTDEQYDVIKTSGDNGYNIYATAGNTDAWFRLWQQATNGFPDVAAYMRVQGNNPDGSRNPAYENLLDVDGLIDYMLVHLWSGDIDAPISAFLNNESPNNIFCLRNTNNTGGFHFVTHDAEHTLLSGNVGIDRFGPFAAGDPTIQGGTAFSKSNPGYLFTQLLKNNEFKLRVADKVQKHCYNGGALTVQANLSRFMARSNEIYQAVVMESARWGNSKRSPSYTRQDWISAVNACASFIQQRTDTLLSQMQSHAVMPALAAPVLSLTGGMVPSGSSLSLANPNASGQIYYTLDGSDPRLPGGAIAPSAQAYAASLTLLNHTYIRARVKNPSANTWSPIAEANIYISQDLTKLIISELMYNPPGDGLVAGDQFEFIELKNVGDRALDLSGLGFSDGITFSFTNGTALGVGQHFLLARSVENFPLRYPGVTVNGFYAGRLDNAGERLTITNALGATVLSFSYGDAAPWPAAPDGFGFSLVAANESAPFDPDNAANWRASSLLYGSPGAGDPPSNIPPILLNEILTLGAPPAVDAVELYNPTATQVDLGGWFLTDDRTTPLKYRIPDGTIIPAEGYLVFDENQFNVPPEAPHSFAFGGRGDDVYLYSGTGPATLTGYSHGFSFGAAATNVTFGRYVNSVGEEHFPAQQADTLRTNNAGPLVGPVVINEIMYHPAPEDYEFVELKNLTATPVPLYDPSYPTNTWRINGLGFDFPSGTVIASNGMILVAGTDPAVFRARYGVPTNIPVLGPFAGTLQDSGELLKLQRPTAPDTNGVAWISVDEVRYNDKAPWPVAADGDGPSLQRRVAGAYGNEPTNWFSSGISAGFENVYNASPSAELIYPTNGAVFNFPVTLTLQCNANDSDGTVIKVEYYANGLKIGETAGSPFSLVWAAFPGSVTLTARATDNGFATTWSSPVTITVNPPPLGTGIGLKAEIYDNMDFTGTLLVRTNATVNFGWGSGAPDPAIGPETFSIRWTGSVQPRFSEAFTFYTVSDDGVRLWVNNQQLIDRWIDQGDTEYSGTISLQAGQLYQITMEYYENGGGATARLLWSSPSVPKEVIPQTQLYPYTSQLPSIVTQPTSQVAALGSNATFSVVAGNNPLGYRWLFNGNPIAGATAAAYTVVHAQYTNEGQYRVVVTNTFGAVTSSIAILTVIEPPVILVQPQSQTADMGGSTTFSVTAEGTLPFQYQWRLYGTNLPGATSQTLTLNNLRLNQAGPYSVRISNAGASTLSSNATLSLNLHLAIVDQPQSVSIGPVTSPVTSSNASFSVNAVGQGALRYQWTFWGTNLPQATNASLTISNVSLDQAGPYAVRVADSVDQMVSSNANLLLLVKPYIILDLQPQSVVSNGTASFTIWAGPVHPTLPMTNQWYRGFASLRTNQEPTLILSPVTNTASYRVVVRNAAGFTNGINAALTVLADADRDGVPDTLEPLVGAEDADGDGMSSAAEVAAGTDPRDAASVLKLIFADPPLAGTQVRFHFLAVSNKTYSVEYREECAMASWSNLLNLDSLNTNRTLWITNSPPPDAPQRYYRAKTPRNL